MNINEFAESMTCSECGGPAFSDLILAEKKDACYNKVRSRYKVWPSAYASGALVQCRKKGAANWGNKSEGVAEGNQIWDGTDWGPQGRFAGDTPVNIGGATMKMIQVGDIVMYLGQKAKVDALSKDRKRARITTSSRTQDVNTSDLKQLGQGVAEAEKIGNMDADAFDDAMARLKKLAGAGPMKTVYDPARRQYRNMPTAVQPPKQPKK